MYTIAPLAVAVQTPAREGISFAHILSTLPTDPASLVVIGMLVASVALVVWAGRRSGGTGGTGGTGGKQA